MIAAFDDGANLHIIKWTGRVRLHAEAQAYCSKIHDASEGVIQVPDAVFERSTPYTIAAGQKRTPCGACRMAAQASAA